MSSISMFGINYHSSDLPVREKLSFSNDDNLDFLESLKNSGIVYESIILSTCNRMEIYAVTNDIDLVINMVGEVKNVCPKTFIRPNCYIYKDNKAVAHLFRVASGLMSMVLGETEIVAQIKNALLLSKSQNMTGKILSGIFQMALSKHLYYQIILKH